MTTVVLTVDCEGAMHDRCYTGEFIRVLEEAFVPATWMIHVSLKDPTANTNLYYHEYAHKIPAWHELGMKVNFENERGYVEDPKERGAILWIAKDTLKSHLIKCTAFRAGCFALMPSDVPYLTEMGVLVDSSVVPDADYRMFVDWTGAPHDPYRSGEDLKAPAPEGLLHLPIATHDGQHGYLDLPWGQLEPLLKANLSRSVITLGIRDYHDSTAQLARTIEFLKAEGCRFSTMTQVASEA